MDIKERIKKISPYFREMQITTTNDGNQVIYVVVSFPHGWIIDDEIENKFGITVGQGTNLSEYYFCVNIDSGEQVLFDAIDYNIEKMQEAIERAQLLSKKTTELKSLFEDEKITIETLRTLKFTYETSTKDETEPIIISKKKNNDNKEDKNE